MARVDVASHRVSADPGRVFAALTDPEELVQWLPPAGMTARFDHFDGRPGGSYRMVLTYDDPDSAAGKSTTGSDVVDARFVELTSGRRVVYTVDFVSADPAFAGTMTMTWELHGEGAETLVEVRAEHVPPGISADDHLAGMASSLENLAAYLERRDGGDLAR